MAGNYVGCLQELCIFLLGDFFNKNNHVVDTTNLAQSKLRPANPSREAEPGLQGVPTASRDWLVFLYWCSREIVFQRTGI